MSRKKPVPVDIFDTDVDYVRRAQSWRLGEPFPLLAGSITEHSLAYDTEHGPTEWISPVKRSGLVVSATEDRTVRLAAAVYAEYTGRRLIRATLQGLPQTLRALAAENVALISTVEEVSGLGEWPTVHAPRTGVLVGRTAEALLALLYRSILRPQFPAARNVTIAHSALQSSGPADVTKFAELDLVTGQRNGLISLKSHGRECCAHLADAVFCGRSSLALTAVARPGLHRASCEIDGKCVRRDLRDSRRVLGKAINADVVLIESCRAVALGDEWLSPDLALSLGVLEGSSVAVLGAMGIYPDLGVSHFVASAVERGLVMGEVLQQLNRDHQAPLSAHPTFALLGDPALQIGRRPAPLPRTTPTRLAPLTVQDARSAPPGNTVRITASAAQDSAMYDFARRIFSGASGDPFSSSPANQVEEMRRNSWDFMHALHDFALETKRPASCAACGNSRATILRLYCTTLTADCEGLICSRCEDAYWHVRPRNRAAALDFVSANLQDKGSRGSVTQLNVTVVNRSAADVPGTMLGVLRQSYGARIPGGYAGNLIVPANSFASHSVALTIPDEPRLDQLHFMWLLQTPLGVLFQNHSIWVD